MEGLLQTVALLSCCVVFLAKQAADAYSKKKNGSMKPRSCPEQMSEWISDLHRWHKPVVDQATGQPRFVWYENSIALQEELQRNRESMNELKSAIEKMNEAIGMLVDQMQNCPAKQQL